MMVRVMLFAAARQFAGTDVLELDLPESATVAQLRTRLVEAVLPVPVRQWVLSLPFEIRYRLA